VFEVVYAKRPGLVSIQGEKGNYPCNPPGLPNVYTVYFPHRHQLEEIPDDTDRVFYSGSFDARLNTQQWKAVIDNRISVLIQILRTGSSLTLTWEVLQESPDMELVSLRLEGLLAATGADPESRIVLPSHGGRMIDPAHTADGQTDHRYNWILDSFGSCGFFTADQLSASLRVMSMDDMITSRVGKYSLGRYAQMGLLLRHRYTTLDPSYRKAKPGQSLPAAEETSLPHVQSFPVQHGKALINLLGTKSLPPCSAWIPAARQIYQTLPDRPSDCYRGRLVYKIYIGSPKDGIMTTWKQAEEIIASVFHETGGQAQLVYLVGFQHNGHDDQYPDVFTPNAQAGTHEELLSLVRKAKTDYNTVISFHDNYDDAYQHSAAFDPDDIGVDPHGKLLRGGVWNGKQAYWISLPRYVQTKAGQRLKKTLQTYPFLQESYHLDVLTASVFRLDFRKDSPSGKQTDLQARLKLIEIFREQGLDVSSEACGLPFIGTISYFWHMQRIPRSLYSGDMRVPVVPFLAHGKADYAGSHTDHPSEILDGLLYGGFFCNDIHACTPLKQLKDAVFMLLLPLDQIRDEEAVWYEEQNGWKTITYSSGAFFAVNFETQECRVRIDGQLWIQNGTATIPQPDGSLLVYVCWEEPYLPIHLPCDLAPGSAVIAKPLAPETPEEILHVSENGLPLSLPPGRAYRVRV
jgi:hypothetical protein